MLNTCRQAWLRQSWSLMRGHYRRDRRSYRQRPARFSLDKPELLVSLAAAGR